jgi:hypothetical protein
MEVKLNVKFTLEQTKQAQSKNRGKLYSFFNATPWSLNPQERDIFHVVKDARWVTGPVWTGAENSRPPPPPPGIRSLDLTARSESLYRLRYPCPQEHHQSNYNLL